MNVGQYFKEARSTIRGNPLRSFLSILGIVIGIVSVVVMLGIGKGAEKKLMDSLASLAKNQIQLYKNPGQGKKDIKITLDTIDYLQNIFPIIDQKITYQTADSMQLSSKNQYGSPDSLSYYGVPISRFNNNERTLLYGSFFTQKQYDNAESVALINEDAYEYYFPKKNNPIGEKLTVNGKTFAIVGVIKRTANEGEYKRKNYEARIPYQTFAAKFPQQSNIGNLSIYLPVNENNVTWQKRISYALMKYYGITHVSAFGMQVDSFSKYIDQIKDQQKMMNYLLLAIGSISLLVGGIGVMNIMLVSVTERTKEIGIRKAIGALKADIILQFLIESLLVTLLGGCIAIILSYGIEILINKYGEAIQLHSMITPDLVGIALVITSITGIVFGILPARRAAKMNPIDALRYE